MSLPAFTQVPGAHNLYNTHEWTRVGTTYSFSTGSYTPFSEGGSGTYESDKSDKPEALHGDRVSAYPYYRKVYSVTTNKPFKIWSFHRNGVDPSIVEYDYITSSYITFYRVTFSWDPFAKTYWSTQIENRKRESITRALNRISDQKAQVLSNLAEARKSVDMMAKSTIKLARVLLAFKRGRISQVPKILGISRSSIKQDRGKSLANYWLEWSYGWYPLITDIHAIQAIVLRDLQRGCPVHATAKSGSSTQISTVWGNRQEDMILKWSSRTAFKGHVENPMHADLNDLGLLDPVPVAWEVLPWSFAVDWLLPIGSTLQASTAACGLAFDSGWTSTRSSYKFTSTLIAEHVNDAWSTLVDPGLYIEEMFSFDRTVYPGFPDAQFYADFTPYSTNRAVNAIALLRQLG